MNSLTRFETSLIKSKHDVLHGLFDNATIISMDKDKFRKTIKVRSNHLSCLD